MIYGPPPESLPLERYQFSTASFPRIPKAEILTPFLTEDTAAAEDADEGEGSEAPAKPDVRDGEPTAYYPAPPASDLPEQFRATLSRLSSLKLEPLPPGCTFTVVVELRDDEDVEPPISRDQSWIAAEPALQKPTKDITDKAAKRGIGASAKSTRGQDRGGIKTTPVRKVEAGAFVLEVWVEEGRRAQNR